MSTSLSEVPPPEPAAGLPIRRDLSIAVCASMTAQQIVDRAYRALGASARLIESAEVLAHCPYLELSSAARRRLGISPVQKRVILRLMLRDPRAALLASQADKLRDEVYAALHEGSVSMWVSKETQL